MTRLKDIVIGAVRNLPLPIMANLGGELLGKLITAIPFRKAELTIVEILLRRVPAAIGAKERVVGEHIVRKVG